MKSLIAIVFMLLFVPLAFGGPPPEQKDEGKCKDHPLFTRMPGYWIHSCDEKEFDAHDFVTGKGTTTRVEGHLWRLSYYPQNSLTSKPQAELQIRRNLQNAVQKLGGTLVGSDRGKDTYRINRNGKEVWVEVGAEFTGKYGYYIVEKRVDGSRGYCGECGERLSNDIRKNGDCRALTVSSTMEATLEAGTGVGGEFGRW